MTKKFIFLLLLMFTGLQIMQAQQAYSIKGIVKDAANGEPVSFANVVIWNTIEGTVTDSIGQFEITGVSPGSYRLQASFIGYKPTVTAEFRISNKDMFFPIELEESSESLQEVSIVASPFRKTAESPLGLRVIGFKEIEKSAGGNRDISRVVQSFPGVASTAAFRNDLMVRGGGPSENRFFLDGVEHREHPEVLSGSLTQISYAKSISTLQPILPRVETLLARFLISSCKTETKKNSPYGE